MQDADEKVQELFALLEKAKGVRGVKKSPRKQHEQRQEAELVHVQQGFRALLAEIESLGQDAQANFPMH